MSKFESLPEPCPDARLAPATSGVEPSAPRCETCRHWKFDEPDWEYDNLRFGECKAIKQRETIESEALAGVEDRWTEAAHALREKAVASAKAIAVDGSGYYAAVRTAPDFGCVLHAALADAERSEVTATGGGEDLG